MVLSRALDHLCLFTGSAKLLRSFMCADVHIFLILIERDKVKKMDKNWEESF